MSWWDEDPPSVHLRPVPRTCAVAVTITRVTAAMRSSLFRASCISYTSSDSTYT